MVNCLLAAQKDMHDTQKVQWAEIVMRKMRKEYAVATTFHSCCISHSLKPLQTRKILFYCMVEIQWRTLVLLNQFRPSTIFPECKRTIERH